MAVDYSFYAVAAAFSEYIICVFNIFVNVRISFASFLTALQQPGIPNDKNRICNP